MFFQSVLAFLGLEACPPHVQADRLLQSGPDESEDDGRGAGTAHALLKGSQEAQQEVRDIDQ